MNYYNNLNGEPHLYLDIDGVLNNTYYFSKGFKDGFFDKNHILHRNDHVLIHKIELLQHFVKFHNITVVGISDCFRDNSEEELTNFSKFLGFKVSRIADPKNNFDSDRTSRVLNDVIEFNVNNFVILDDDYRAYMDVLDHEFYKDKPYWTIRSCLVNPVGRYGMNEEHLHQAESILNVKNENDLMMTYNYFHEL